ncbi:MAG: hypothetical protein OEZ32_09485 [Nitrospinota bacterium]|nr:hypothetical protein [Nitrospinota bacterium]
MHKFEPHLELRSNLGTNFTEDSVWPTFTDIMTVVLMIFMLTMVASMLTNADLARQLMTAMEEKDVSTQKLGESLSQLEFMQMKIAALEESLEKKKMEMILLADTAKMLETDLAAKDTIIVELESQVSELDKNILALGEKVSDSNKLLEQAGKDNAERIAALLKAHQLELNRLEDERRQTMVFLTKEAESKLKTSNDKLGALLVALKEKEKTVDALKRKEEKLELTLARQRSAYTVLEDKYNKLIGPARSTLGKMVVNVRYSREGRTYTILFKDAGAEKYENISEKELHQRLERLKNKLGKKLYVRVIIPEESNLSYNEAWTFTNSLLTKYDYYYQRED